jgi:hypothetical protein
VSIEIKFFIVKVSFKLKKIEERFLTLRDLIPFYS